MKPGAISGDDHRETEAEGDGEVEREGILRPPARRGHEAADRVAQLTGRRGAPARLALAIRPGTSRSPVRRSPRWTRKARRELDEPG
jgi:hypothetical protein